MRGPLDRPDLGVHLLDPLFWQEMGMTQCSRLLTKHCLGPLGVVDFNYFTVSGYACYQELTRSRHADNRRASAEKFMHVANYIKLMVNSYSAEAQQAEVGDALKLRR